MKISALLAAVFGLAACAVQPLPPLPASHPASPQAEEAPAYTLSSPLAGDEATRTTQSLLATPSPDGAANH